MSARLLSLPETRRVRYWPILAVALCLRLVVIAIVLFSYPHDWLFSKAPDLGYLAQSVATGHGFSSPFGGATGPSAFLAPGYPMLLAALFRIFGGYSFAAAASLVCLQAIFGLLTVALLMHVAGRVFGPEAANVAGLCWAVSPTLLWLPAVPWETSLSILLLTGMAALALHSTHRRANSYWLASGAYCGLAMLVNPSLTLALCAMLAWAAWQAKPAARAGLALSLLALLAVFLPWPVRNARVLHAFIPFRSNFGYELWQGNHAGGDGLFTASIEPLKNKQEYAEYAAQGEVTYMRRKTSVALAYIRHRPGRFLLRCLERFVRFWTGTGSRENSPLIVVHATLFSLLGIAGLALLLRERRDAAMLFLAPLLLFPLPYYLTHPDFRFRLVLDPLLTVLSAHALLRLRQT